MDILTFIYDPFFWALLSMFALVGAGVVVGGKKLGRYPLFGIVIVIIFGFAASNARTEDLAPHTLTSTDQVNHLNLLKQLSPDQVKALSGIYPDFRLLMLCSGRFSGADRDELVLGIWKPQDSKPNWKREVHRVGLIWTSSGWDVHIIDDELENDEEISLVFPMKWQYAFSANGFSGEIKCGLDSGIEGDPNLTYDLGDKPFFDLKEKGLSNHKLVCFATDNVYNNWDCIVYSPKEGRFRLWFQQAHAD